MTLERDGATLSRYALGTLLALALAGAPAAAGQLVPDTVPARDAFGDAGVEALIRRARLARTRDIEGIESYEGVLRERIYVGLTAFRFRRERALFEQERVARIRWSRDGRRAIEWIGARRALPIVGVDGGDGERGGELRDELLRESRIAGFPFEPDDDRLVFGEGWALHPLADSALAHYRYRAGDTLRVTLPAGQIELLEVRVEPRRADFHLVAGSLWFDRESAALVRATYRPARPFDMAIDEPDEDVPGWLGPIQAELDYVTVEYSLHESRFWLPRRFAVEGEARIGSLLRIPLTVEWSVGDYRVNEVESELPLTGPLPPGWARREERVEEKDGTVRFVTVVVPPADALLRSSALTEVAAPRSPSVFSAEELADLEESLEALLPTYRRLRPRLAFGVGEGLLRFNRVEGLSVGGRATLPLSPRWLVEAEARYGTASEEVHGALTVRRGSEEGGWWLAAYRRLESMDPADDPFSLPSSLAGLALGSGRGQFYRATGATLGGVSTGTDVRVEVGLFAERQEAVSLGTDFYLTSFFRDDTVATVLAADEVDVHGLRGTIQWFRGTDPDALVLTGALGGEAAWGDARYRRLAGRASASHPLPLGLAGALEVGAATTWFDGTPPLQRSFFLGGPATLRGFDPYEIGGDTFWRARAELATGFAGARLVAFGDAGWAGPRDAFTWEARLASVGAGASLLDGLMRADLARAVRGGSRWRIHLYLDGLF